MKVFALRIPSNDSLDGFSHFAGWGVGGSRKSEITFSTVPNAYANPLHSLVATVLTDMSYP
jgi:plasmid rolling circle replication initiator protein Rep